MAAQKKKKSKTSSTEPQGFWVRNISKRDVNLGTIRCRVPVGTTVNLLNRFNTMEKIEESLKEGQLGILMDEQLTRVSGPTRSIFQVTKKEQALPGTFPSKERGMVVVEQDFADNFEDDDDDDELMDQYYEDEGIDSTNTPGATDNGMVVVTKQVGKRTDEKVTEEILKQMKQAQEAVQVKQSGKDTFVVNNEG